MKKSLLLQLSMLAALLIFTYGKCFNDFADSIVLNIDPTTNLLTNARFSIKPAKAGEQGFTRQYFIKEINDSLASISKKLNIAPLNLQNTFKWNLTGFTLTTSKKDSLDPTPPDFSILQAASLKLSTVDDGGNVVEKMIYDISRTVVADSFINVKSRHFTVPINDIKGIIATALDRDLRFPGTGYIKYTLVLTTSKDVDSTFNVNFFPEGQVEILLK